MTNCVKRTLLSIVIPSLVLVSGLWLTPSKALATTTVNLLTADPFVVLAGSSVNDANISVIVGNVGLSPATWSSALTCAEVTGTIYSVDGTGPLPCRVTNSGLLTQAKTDLTTAFTDAANRTPFTTLAGGDNQLGSQVLTDGVYTFSGATSANLSGTLTLDGQGNANAVFIFKASSTLVTASSSVVSLINGAQACNVFWEVPTSATLGTGSTFIGTVMADQAITDNGGSTITGRFLASSAAVTLNNTHITKPTCTTPSPTPTPTPAPGSSSGSAASNGNSGSSAAICPAVNYNTPIILNSKRIDPTSVYLSWGPYSGTESFNVRYGLTNGQWLYNMDVTGFAATINALPANQPIWVQVAARNNCSIGTYGTPMLVGGSLIPLLPNTGFAPTHHNFVWEFVISFFTALKSRI